MDRSLELAGAHFCTFPLTAEHGPALQRVFEASADFFELVFGRGPLPSDANAAFSAGPELDSHDHGDKVLLGIAPAGSKDLLGVLDVFRDYPGRGTWYIGLLLFSKDERRRGLGSEVVEAVASAARGSGAHELQLNVVEQNEHAFRFWRSAGFVEVRRWRMRFVERESTFIRMRRAL